MPISFRRAIWRWRDAIVAAGGAVCSPYEPARPAMPHQFLERNAIVAGLADAVVVVEAPSRSGALNTAAWAAGRIPVLVFPGDVDRRNVAGCLALIRDGATLVRDAADILAELRVDAAPPPQHERTMPFKPNDALQTSILEMLESEAQSQDQLIEDLDSDAPSVLSALTQLELAGAIERREAGVFARR